MTRVLALAAGDWQAALLPARGAALLRLTWRGRDILAPVPEGADPNAAFAGAFLMAPWANRLDQGRIAAHGRVWRLAINRPQDRTAIHGLVRDHAWDVVRSEAAAARLCLALDAPPFALDARLALDLSESGLDLALSLTARGDQAQPLGLGWHPWFARSPGTRLGFAARWRCRHDARQLPATAEPFGRLDGAEESYLGLDTHFAGWDGAAVIRHPDGTTIRLAAQGAWAAGLQVFAPPDRPVLCVEPVSHLPDAPNRPVLAPLGPLAMVPPGGMIAGRLRLHAG
jgi:aldose 1-epimerase